MAELTGLSQGFLSVLESGSRRLTNIDRVMDFLDGLGVPSELLRLMSGDTRLGAGVLSYVAIQSYSTGHPRDAVGAARAARERTRSAGATALHAMLLTRQARGHAELGEREECLRALGQASGLCAGGRSENDPRWPYWINGGEIHGQTGSCFLDLGESGRAADSFPLAYDAMNPEEVRTRALFRARAATAQLRSGEHEEGRATAERAVTLAERVQSARLNDHLGDVAEELRGVRHTSEAGDLLDRVAALTAKGNR